jgi:hypothetical protein
MSTVSERLTPARTTLSCGKDGSVRVPALAGLDVAELDVPRPREGEDVEGRHARAQADEGGDVEVLGLDEGVEGVVLTWLGERAIRVPLLCKFGIVGDEVAPRPV